MNHAFKFHDITTSLVDFRTAVISMINTAVKLLIETVASVNQSLPFLVKHFDPCVLSKAFLFPFRKCTVALVNSALLHLSLFLLLSNWVFHVFIFSFNTLVVHHGAWNVIFNLSDVLFFWWYLNSDSLNLFLNLSWFISFISILLMQDI